MGNVYDSALAVLSHNPSIPQSGEVDTMGLQDTEEYEVMMARGVNIGPAYKNVTHASAQQAAEIYEQLP